MRYLGRKHQSVVIETLEILIFLMLEQSMYIGTYPVLRFPRVLDRSTLPLLHAQAAQQGETPSPWEESKVSLTSLWTPEPDCLSTRLIPKVLGGFLWAPTTQTFHSPQNLVVPGTSSGVLGTRYLAGFHECKLKTMRYHYTHIRMGKVFKKTYNMTHW